MIRLTRISEINRWRKRSRWVLVYGRRKTGKSFFIKNFTKWDKYFFIGRSGEIFEDDNKINYETFVRVVFDSLRTNKTVVVDEIQRLPEEFYDRLHKEGVAGDLIAVSSTLWLAKDLIGKRSALLGLLSEFKMEVIDERDIIINLVKYIKNSKQLIEYSVYLREPWLIPFWERAENFLLSMATDTKITIPALVGEIFSEEERELSTVYEGILKAVSDGKRVSGEITSHLFSQGLIPTQNPSQVHPYLSNLHKLGLLEKIKVFNKNKYYYYHKSSVMDLYYYLSAKYGFAERSLPDEQVEKVLSGKMPMHVEQFFRGLLSKIYGLGIEIISEKDYEIDIVLTDFKKIKVIGEVKWKNKISIGEVKHLEEVFGKFSCEKILIVPDKKAVAYKPKDIDIWDVKTVLGKLKELGLK